jgi:hypothetical protein
LIACQPSASIIPTQSEPPTHIVNGVHLDWAYELKNLSELCASAHVIVVGTVAEAVDKQGTEWNIRVEKFLKGKKTNRIIVTGTSNQQAADVNWDLAFNRGDRYLLFLREKSSGVYSPFIPSGKYMIWKDKVYSLNHIVIMEQSDFPGVDFNGVSLDAVVQEITRITDYILLSFTVKPGVPVEIMRCSSPATIDITMFTGQHEGRATYAIDKSNFPQGVEATIYPAEFIVEAQMSYKSTLVVSSAPLTRCTITIPVVCNVGENASGHRSVTLYIE